ncbi:hypothetical protein EG827_02740 [bacterium]|nr:hypothetical protein [bacterium]
MKKTFLFITFLCLIAASALAQPEKGNLMFNVTSTMPLRGGWGSELMSAVFSKTSYNNGSSTEDINNKTTYNLLPKAGYFIIDNLVAGLEVLVSGYSEENTYSEGKYSESLLGVGPFVRYYYPLEKIYPFAELETLFGRYMYKWPTSGGTYEEEKDSFFLVGGFLGAALPLTEKVTFDIQAGYLYTSFSFSGEVYGEGEDYKEITGGVGIKMGFTIYL